MASTFSVRLIHKAGELSFQGEDYLSAGGTAEDLIVDGYSWLTDLVAANRPDKLPNFTTSDGVNWSDRTYTINAPYTAHHSQVYLGDYVCKVIAPEMKRQAADVTSIYRATDNSPIYYIENNSIVILPNSGTPLINIVKLPDIGDFDVTTMTSLGNLPTEYENIIILYVASRLIQRKQMWYINTYGNINDTTSDIAVTIDAVTSNLSTALDRINNLYDEG